MDYKKVILNKLIDMYERREAYNKEPSSVRTISLNVAKEFPEYVDRYNYDGYRDINVAIETLENVGYISSVQSNTGQYTKVKLIIWQIDTIYGVLKRESIPVQSKRQAEILQKYKDCSTDIVQRVVASFEELILSNKKIPYEIKYDYKKLQGVLDILVAVVALEKETYIRNFSTALFKDSKTFQREYKSIVESILFDFTDEIVEKDKILEFYNLYENPTYVLIKGGARIEIESSIINTEEMKDGIALSNASLEAIKNICISADSVVTVENLTTYHDSDDSNSVYFYLGGFHNQSKQKLLKKIYADNPNCNYYHKGDLDVYGFLILENLIAKTGIPFFPMEMDVETLDRFYKAGMYKELSERDKKVIAEKKCGQLKRYADVLNYMLEKNCKVEQESIKAVELIEKA